MAYGYNPRPENYGYIADIGRTGAATIMGVAKAQDDQRKELNRAQEAAKKLAGNREGLHSRYMQLKETVTQQLTEAGYKPEEADRVFRMNVPPPTDYHYEHPDKIVAPWAKGLDRTLKMAESRKSQTDSAQFAEYASTPQEVKPSQMSPSDFQRAPMDELQTMAQQGSVERMPAAADLERKMYDLAPDAREAVEPMVKRRFEDEKAATERGERMQQTYDLAQKPPKTQYEGYMRLQQPEKAVESLPKNLLEIDETTERINAHEQKRQRVGGLSPKDLHAQRKDVAMELGRAERSLAANQKLQKDLKRAIADFETKGMLSADIVQALGSQGVDVSGGDAQNFQDMLARVRVSEGEARQNVKRAQQMLKEMNSDPQLGSRQAAAMAEQQMQREEDIEGRAARIYQRLHESGQYSPEEIRQILEQELGSVGGGRGAFGATPAASTPVAPGRLFNLRTPGSVGVGSAAGPNKLFKILSVE